jgi:precorrin-6B methylase 2
MFRPTRREDMSPPAGREHEGTTWPRGIWDRYPEIDQREVDTRFGPVIQQVIRRAALSPGQHVLDLGTGTGSVALQVAALVAPHGDVLAVDLSPAMLAVAQQRARAMDVGNVRFREGRAEAIPAEDGAVHVVLASLSLM